MDGPGYEPGDYSLVQIEEEHERILSSELFSILNVLVVSLEKAGGEC